MHAFRIGRTMLFALALLSVPAYAEVVAAEVQQQAFFSSFTVHMKARTKADMKSVWSVLTDFENFHAFVPGFTESHLVSSPGEPTVLHLHGYFGYKGPMSMIVPEEMDLRFDVTPNEVLRFCSVGGTLRSYLGEIRTTPVDDEIELEVFIRASVGRPVAPFISPALEKERAIRKLEGGIQEMERRAGITAQPPEKR